MTEIRHSGNPELVLFASSTAETVEEALQEAIDAGQSLAGFNLRGVDMRLVDRKNADFTDADLTDCLE